MAYIVLTATTDPPVGDQVGLLLKRGAKGANPFPPACTAPAAPSAPTIGQLWPRGDADTTSGTTFIARERTIEEA